MTNEILSPIDRPERWITVHQMPTTKRRPEGIPTRVKASAVDSVRGYLSGGSTITVNGVYMHLTEDADAVLGMLPGPPPHGAIV